MDETIVTKDNTNSYAIALIALFLFIILIVIIIAIILIYVIPKNDVQEFQACVNQSECVNGLVCDKSRLDNTNRCLGGLNYSCNQDSDCASAFTCQVGTGGVKLCLNPPSTTLTLIDQPLMLQNNLLQNNCLKTNVNDTFLHKSLTTCHQMKPAEPLKPVYNYDFNNIYNNIRNVDCQFTNDKKKLAYYL